MEDAELDEIRSRINPAYKDRVGTESYERRLLVEYIDHLRVELETTKRHMAEDTRDIGAMEDQVNSLLAENANLKAATQGHTFFHSDEIVNRQLGRLRADNASLTAEMARLREELAGEKEKASKFDELTDRQSEHISEIAAELDKAEADLATAEHRIKELTAKEDGNGTTD